MLVQFKRLWFKKGYYRFKPNKFGVEVPDALADELPSDAVVLVPPAAPAKAKRQKSSSAPEPTDEEAPPDSSPSSPEEPTTLSELSKKQPLTTVRPG